MPAYIHKFLRLHACEVMCCILLLIKRRRMVRGGLLQKDGASHRYTHIQTDSNCNITYYYCILPRWWRQFYCDNKVLEMESLFIEYFVLLFSTLTGYFDENFYPAYYEDDDYAIRIHLSQHFYATSWRIPPWCTERLTAAKVDILHYIHTYTHAYTWWGTCATEANMIHYKHINNIL